MKSKCFYSKENVISAATTTLVMERILKSFSCSNICMLQSVSAIFLGHGAQHQSVRGLFLTRRLLRFFTAVEFFFVREERQTHTWPERWPQRPRAKSPGLFFHGIRKYFLDFTAVFAWQA